MLITPLLLLIIDRLDHILQLLARPATRWVIFGGYALSLVGLFVQQGIVLDKEAAKYIGCAQEVLHGDLHDLLGNYLKHAAYIVFLIPFAAIGPVALAVVAQVGLLVWAGLALARTTTRLTSHAALGNMALALFLLCPMIQAWSLTLYTEAFYTAVSVLFVAQVASSDQLRPGILVLAVLTLFARPVGLFVLGVVLIWTCTRTVIGGWRKTIRSAGCIALVCVAVLLPGIREAQLLPIARGEVIAGVEGARSVAVDLHGSRIVDAHFSLLDHLSATEWISLTAARMKSLFTLTRPHYSTPHNLLNAAFYLLYPFALIGAWTMRRDTLVQIVLATILLNTAFIGLTHDEWSGRFMVPLLPWLILLACLGLSVIADARRVQRQRAP